MPNISHFSTPESVHTEVFSHISKIIPDNQQKIHMILSHPTIQIFQKKILQEQRRARPNEDLMNIYTQKIVDFSKDFL